MVRPLSDSHDSYWNIQSHWPHWEFIAHPDGHREWSRIAKAMDSRILKDVADKSPTSGTVRFVGYHIYGQKRRTFGILLWHIYCYMSDTCRAGAIPSNHIIDHTGWTKEELNLCGIHEFKRSDGLCSNGLWYLDKNMTDALIDFIQESPTEKLLIEIHKDKLFL